MGTGLQSCGTQVPPLPGRTLDNGNSIVFPGAPELTFRLSLNRSDNRPEGDPVTVEAWLHATE